MLTFEFDRFHDLIDFTILTPCCRFLDAKTWFTKNEFKWTFLITMFMRV